MERIELDANATVPMKPEIWAAMRPYADAAFGNPSSPHSAGRKARKALDEAGETVARLLGAYPDEVIFTSGATEANNLAIFGLVGNAPGHVIASRLEHPCVIGPIEELRGQGCIVDWLPVSKRGQVSIADVTRLSKPDTRLVTVQLANHETGAIQPVAEIAAAIPPGVSFHCDAAQAVGKVPVNFHALGVTSVAVSAHKFGGTPGAGVLLLKRGATLRPRAFGGHQQRGRRPGTESVFLAMGLAKALELAVGELNQNRHRLELLRGFLFERLRSTSTRVVLNGPEIDAADIVPTTLNVSFPDCRADVLLMALDLAGVACSTGSACSSGSLLPSPVLKAMGASDDVLRSAVRFSFAADRTEEEMAEAARRIASCVERLRRETFRTSEYPLPSPV